MSNISSDRIDDVAPGDIIAVDHDTGQTQPSKVVFKEPDEDTGVYTITFEDDDGETFQREIPAGTVVTHAMESKWESGESPTPHSGGVIGPVGHHNGISNPRSDSGRGPK